MTETTVPDDQKRRVVEGCNALAETYDTLRFVQVCAQRLVERALGHRCWTSPQAPGEPPWLRPTTSARPAGCSGWIWPPSYWSALCRRSPPRA